MNKLVNCGMQLKKQKYIFKMFKGPEPVKIPSKSCNGIILLNEKKKCCNAYDLFIIISPITPVMYKTVRFSDFPLILIIHRETKCVFELSTEFASVKIKTK